MIQLYPIILKGVEGLLQILDMDHNHLALDEHVIHVYLHVPPDLIFEDLVY